MMSTTSYGEKPQTHRVNNIGPTLFRLIGITNPTAGDTSDAPSTDFSIAPEITNHWFRGYRHMLSDAMSADHRHANPVVIVNVEGQAAVLTNKAWRELASPGALVFVDAGTVHALRGKTDGAQVVEVEIRQPSVK
jgi:hypothetical protein